MIEGEWRFNYNKAHFYEKDPDGELKAICGVKTVRTDGPAFPNAHLGFECQKCLQKLREGSGTK